MPERDLQILETSHSFADKFVLFVAKSFGVLRTSAIIFSLVYCLWIGWAFSGKLREALHSTFWSILIYIVATALIFAVGFLWSKVFLSFVFGKPTFGKLGGMPIPTFSAAIRASSQIAVEFREQDQPTAKIYDLIQVRGLHDILKAKFVQLRKLEGDAENKIEAAWQDVWEHQILDMTFGGQTLREATDPNKFGINYAMSALLRSTLVVPSLVTLFWFVTVFLIYMYANQRLELLTGAQIGVALSLVFAGVWYAFVLHNLSAVPLTFVGLPAPTRKEFADDIHKLDGNEIRPKNIRVKRRFYGIVRNHQLRLLVCSLLVDTGILLLLLAAIHGVILLVDPQYARSIGSYHAVMAYGILVAAAGLVSSFYVFSVLLQNLRKVSAALIAAVLSAGLPFLLDYLLGGKFDMAGLRTAIIAGSGGLTAALVTVITSNVKSSME
jgi:hypothetical protein